MWTDRLSHWFAISLITAVREGVTAFRGGQTYRTWKPNSFRALGSRRRYRLAGTDVSTCFPRTVLTFSPPAKRGLTTTFSSCRNNDPKHWHAAREPQFDHVLHTENNKIYWNFCGIMIRMRARPRHFIFSIMSNRSGAHPASSPFSTGISFLGDKAAGY